MSIKCPKCNSENPVTSSFCADCGTQLSSSKGIDASVTRTLETTRDELARGTLFAGRYEVIEELGQGGMGRVYRVHDTKLNEEVALKLIRPEIGVDKRTVERFRNELKTARKIRHKNVCGMYDFHEEGKTLYLTMEYVRGEDLKSLIHRTKILSVGTALAIARQVAEGLAEAHRLGVVHRDLKPGNVMIDKDGQAKIMDFGIARSLLGKGLTGEGAIIGTPEYMSPEQVEGKEADQCSDIYSLGIILFEMLTGRVPFEGETAFSIANKHLRELPPDPRKLAPQIPEILSRLILRCLEKDKARRYQNAEELITNLVAVEESLPTAERVTPKRKTITPREITVKFQPRKLVIPFAVLIVIVAAALIFIPSLLHKNTSVVPKIENSIAVISFENLTGDSQYESLVKAVPSLFITKFESMGFSYVATLERLRDLLKQMGKDPFAPIDPDTGFAACRREGIRALVVGNITRAGDVFAIDVKVLDVDTKKALASASSHGQGEDSILLSQIDDLSAQITQKLGWSAQKIASAQSVSEVTTSSMEAYNYYLKGNELTLKADFNEAICNYRKAVEIDPDFAMAYRGMIRVYYHMGLPEEARQAGEKAMALVNRTTLKEKLYIQESYAFYVQHDIEKRYQILKQLVEKYPKEKEAHWEICVFYRVRNLPDEVIKEAQAALDLDPNYNPALSEMVLAYMAKEDFSKALEYGKRLVAAEPNDPDPLRIMGGIYIRIGQLDLAIESFTKALSFRPDYYGSLRSIGYIYALKENYSEAIKWANEYATRSTAASFIAEGYMFKAFYDYWTGSFQKALDATERFQMVGEETRDPEWLANSSMLKGAIYRAQKKLDLSYDNYKQMHDTLINTYPNFASVNRAFKERDLGSIEIEAGKIEAARKRLITLNLLLAEVKVPRQIELVEYSQEILKEEILMAEGDFAEAISVLEGLRNPWLSSYRLSFTPWDICDKNFYQEEANLARAYEMKGDIDKAIGVLERRTRFDAATKDFRLTPPKFYYDLGRLYEKKGLKGKARDNYGKFLDLWKDADPGIAEVEDARERFAGLKG